MTVREPRPPTFTPLNRRAVTEELAAVRERDKSLTVTCVCGVFQRIGYKQGIQRMDEKVQRFAWAHRKCKAAA